MKPPAWRAVRMTTIDRDTAAGECPHGRHVDPLLTLRGLIRAQQAAWASVPNRLLPQAISAKARHSKSCGIVP